MQQLEYSGYGKTVRNNTFWDKLQECVGLLERRKIGMKKIVDNLIKVFVEKGVAETDIIFLKSTEEQMQQLQDLMGNNAKEVLEFYKKYQPEVTPMLPCYLSLLNIDEIVIENTCAEPGMHLAKYGVITIGVTVGGNVVCIDTNDVSEAGPKILLFDSNFCYYDDEDDIARIGYIPSSVEHLFDLAYDQKDPVLSYENIQKCGHVLSESFMDFMEKLSCNYFEDIEEFLD